MEDLQGLSPSLRDSEYFRDLEEATLTSQTPASTGTTKGTVSKAQQPVDSQLLSNTDSPIADADWPTQTSLTTHCPYVDATSLPYGKHPSEELPSDLVTRLSLELLSGCIFDSGDSTDPFLHLNLTSTQNGQLGSLETIKPITGLEGIKDKAMMDLDGQPDLDSLPILVRSMSTSRRHSWGVPLSPISSARR